MRGLRGDREIRAARRERRLLGRLAAIVDVRRCARRRRAAPAPDPSRSRGRSARASATESWPLPQPASHASACAGLLARRAARRAPADSAGDRRRTARRRSRSDRRRTCRWDARATDIVPGNRRRPRSSASIQRTNSSVSPTNTYMPYVRWRSSQMPSSPRKPKSLPRLMPSGPCSRRSRTRPRAARTAACASASLKKNRAPGASRTGAGRRCSARRRSPSRGRAAARARARRAARRRSCASRPSETGERPAHTGALPFMAVVSTVPQ